MGPVEPATEVCAPDWELNLINKAGDYITQPSLLLDMAMQLSSGQRSESTVLCRTFGKAAYTDLTQLGGESLYLLHLFLLLA